MRIAIVGCGFVADFYVKTLANYPSLEIAGVMDRDHGRAERFAALYGLGIYKSLKELLADSTVAIVVNLTNPRSHFEVTKACLEAGKHVYSEKPLSMVFEEAEELGRLAESRGLYLTAAPCSILGETAQTMWKALRGNVIGKVRLVYAELDNGLVHRRNYKEWISDSGSPWPYKDEFEIGCTMEHAGYFVTWLTAFFGPAITVTSFASTLIPDKETDVPLDTMTADFATACIEFPSGVVARVTCSIMAPHDHSLRIIGDEGILVTDDCWNYSSPVYIKRHGAQPFPWWARHKSLRKLVKTGEEYPLVRRSDGHLRYKGSHQMDFARGIADLAEAASEKRPSVLSTRWSLHVNEIVLAMQYPERMGSPRKLKTTFEPMKPMQWAKP